MLSDRQNWLGGTRCKYKNAVEENGVSAKKERVRWKMQKNIDKTLHDRQSQFTY